MREIEIKARVQDLSQLKKSLESQAVVFGPPLKQHDTVYNEPGGKTATPGYNFLRVRTENDVLSTFTLKQTVKDLDKIEHETVIDQPEEMKTMIELMHFELFSDLTKIRQKAKYQGYEICLDSVEGLGDFIEIEKLTAGDADGDAVRDEMWRVLEALGVGRDGEVKKGYDILMREKQGL